MANVKETVAKLIEKTSGAYSFDRYQSWESCIKALLKKQYNEQQIEAILCSKLTRWAADVADKPYGKATSKDLLAYLEKSETLESINKLTKEHFNS